MCAYINLSRYKSPGSHRVSPSLERVAAGLTPARTNAALARTAPMSVHPTELPGLAASLAVRKSLELNPEPAPAPWRSPRARGMRCSLASFMRPRPLPPPLRPPSLAWAGKRSPRHVRRRRGLLVGRGRRASRAGGLRCTRRHSTRRARPAASPAAGSRTWPSRPWTSSSATCRWASRCWLDLDRWVIYARCPISIGRTIRDAISVVRVIRRLFDAGTSFLNQATSCYRT